MTVLFYFELASWGHHTASQTPDLFTVPMYLMQTWNCVLCSHLWHTYCKSRSWSGLGQQTLLGKLLSSHTMLNTETPGWTPVTDAALDLSRRA